MRRITLIFAVSFLIIHVNPRHQRYPRSMKFVFIRQAFNYSDTN